MGTNMPEAGSDIAPETPSAAGGMWYAGLLVIGLFFIYRGFRLGVGLIKAGHFPVVQSVLCVDYLFLGFGLMKRKYWARTLALVSCPCIFLFALFLIQKYPRAALQSSTRALAFAAAAAFIYLLIPRAAKEFTRAAKAAARRRDNLAPPPRHVPLTLKLSAVFGNQFMLMTWLIPGFVFCGVAHELRKAGVCVERDMPRGFAAVWLLAWLFFLGGIVFMSVRLARWILSGELRLLEHGMLSQAVLKSKTEIDLPGDGGPLYRLSFAYEVNGRKFHTGMDTPYPGRLLDEAAEPVLYDPQEPRKSTLLDDLPAHVEFDDTGNLLHRCPFMGFVYLLIPLGTLACMVYMTVKR